MTFGTTPRALLLDMGGVLLDMVNEVGIPEGKLDFRGREQLMHVLRATGGRVTSDELEALLFAPWRRDYARRYETGREASWEEPLRRLRKGTGSRARNRTLLGAWFAPYAESLRPLAGALDAVAALRSRGIRLAVVSNVALPGEHYDRVLEREGLLRDLPHRFFSYDQGSRKPSPVMVRRALEALGMPAADTAFVGDRRNSDVAAGLAAGVRTVWIRSRDRGGPRPDLEVGSLNEAVAALFG
jgi:HAD superfamily hydrolase (TIGR01662 family)